MASTPPIRKRDPTATRYDSLTYDEAIARNLSIMDMAAFALARENRIPIIVFSIKEPNAISSALLGRGPGHPRVVVSRRDAVRAATSTL